MGGPWPPGGAGWNPALYVAPAKAPEQEGLLLVAFAALILLLVVGLLLIGLLVALIALIALVGFLLIPLRAVLLRIVVLLTHSHTSIFVCGVDMFFIHWC